MGVDPLDLKTEWNQAKAYQLRLHEISILLSNARRRKDYVSWSVELWNFYSELSSQMTDEELTSAGDKLRAADSIERLSYYNDRLFPAYMEVELLLRKVMRDRGMLLPGTQDPKKAIQ